ncbi:nitrite reductase small subunit NirD [Allohahella marinimesophila]|uniref:Rieske domain-containing protein n=1 Tax=Allohahella marinimesophila TaxID=1054972 RepID=A0ABP7Q0S4_9GAMM
MSNFTTVCSVDDIIGNLGVNVLVEGRQVAIFIIDDQPYALSNFDPFSKVNILSRGIIGDLKGELVVASPVYKQHFSLATGRCLEDASVSVPVYPVRIYEGQVQVSVADEASAAA